VPTLRKISAFKLGAHRSSR